MERHLRSRLRRIRGLEDGRTRKAETPGEEKNFSLAAGFPGWASAGSQTLTRSVFLDMPLAFPRPLPRSLPILVPDLFRFSVSPGTPVSEEDFLFFDLETTGLSGGAGTVAFLAAFGRLERYGPGEGRLKISQYLLLDYPGEADFLQALLGEFTGPAKPLVVTYNGKSFDGPILRTRCLMNGIPPPVYRQADLLHPARRLWKRMLPSCSQGVIEESVLDLDRSGDISGAMAPDIWFSFLRSGGSGPLLGVCDHNVRDILGLAVLFAALARIAGDPLRTWERYGVDLESLALRWRETAKAPESAGSVFAGRVSPEGTTAEKLLEMAAARGWPQARYLRGKDLLQTRGAAGRKELAALAGEMVLPAGLRAAAYRTLAIDAEWCLNDRKAALDFTEAALELVGIGDRMRRNLLRRRERLYGPPERG
jgi:uncharacterized protein YprB with RNaseH-like and TPR domain